jgi:hypothetical protein
MFESVKRWLRGEPLFGDRDYDQYERVKRGITRKQQLDEGSRDFLNGRDEVKESYRRSRNANRDAR